MKRAARLGTTAVALHVAVALLWGAIAQGVAASELALEWSAPTDCPGRDELEARVSRLVGGAVKSNLTAATDVTRTADAYRAHLRIISAAGFGERVLENRRCELLTDSVALVIALSATSSPDSANDNGMRDEPSEGVTLAGSAHASVLSGTLPNPAFGIGAGVSMEGLAALRFELRGSYYFRQSKTFDNSVVGGSFGLIAFGARGCRVWSFGAWELGPCVGAQVYHVAATGFGGEVVRHGDATWGGPALGVFGRLRIVKAFAIYVAADGVVALARRSFVFSDVGELHRASALALQLLVAPEVRF
jgi:hypothetical protein